MSNEKRYAEALEKIRTEVLDTQGAKAVAIADEALNLSPAEVSSMSSQSKKHEPKVIVLALSEKAAKVVRAGMDALADEGFREIGKSIVAEINSQLGEGA